MNVEKISLIVGGVLLAVLAGVGIKATSYVLSDSFKANHEVVDVADLDFTNMYASTLVNDEDVNTVLNNRVEDISFENLDTDLSHLVLLDKILLGYYLSYSGENNIDLLLTMKSDLKYPEDSVQILVFSDGKNYYKLLKDSYNAKSLREKDLQIINPNASSDILSDYFFYADFVFDVPENLEKVLLGLNAYFELINNPNPTDEMLQNPDPNMCMVARIHPDTRMLPEELECNF